MSLWEYLSPHEFISFLNIFFAPVCYLPEVGGPTALLLDTDSLTAMSDLYTDTELLSQLSCLLVGMHHFLGSLGVVMRELTVLTLYCSMSPLPV